MKGKNNKKIYFKFISTFLMFIMLITSNINVIAASYGEIVLLEEIENEYTGASLASSRMNTIAFSDVPNGYWGKEAIARAGALEIIKGWDDNFYPTKEVSRAESLAIMIRLMGRNTEAEELTDTITANWDLDNVNMKDLWAIGHIQLTRDLEFISDTDYNDALYPNQNELNENENFIIGNGAYRYEIAEWICKTLEQIAPDDVIYDFHYSDIYDYKDWQDIPLDKRVYVDFVTRLDIMIGSDGYFYPNNKITRAEVAKLVENLDELYYKSINVTKKMGYVADILNDIKTENDEDIRAIYTYIRSANGRVDRIYTTASRNNINQITLNEIIVYKNGRVGRANMLEKGDVIDYLVNENNEVIYVNVENNDIYEIEASIYDMRDISTGKMVLKLKDGRFYDGILKYELYDTETEELLIDNTRYKLKDLPFTTNYKFTIKGNVITKIDYVGEEELFEELRGIVKNIDLVKKQITIFDSNANEITKSWENDVQVEKQEYYESADEIGYIDEVFKEYLFDKMDTSVNNIDIGDTVYLRFKDNGKIKKIDVGTNYGVKYAKIKNINYYGVEGTEIIVGYEDESSETLELESNVIVKKNGMKVPVSSLVPGDWIKILYNRGIINSNNVIDKVKQINVNGVENQITEILKGELIYFDSYQGRMNFSNVERLESSGFSDFMNIKTLKLSRDCVYYDEDNRVTLDYVREFMINYGTAYIGIGENLGENEIVKLTFRNSREKVLEEDNVNYSKGNGEFKLTSESNSILADDGTIIRRYGRLVDKESIVSPDLAKVVLNGQRTAAIIDIKEEISNNEIGIYRAKIKSLIERTSFEVYSFSKLLDMEWSYMPLERNFEINSKTDIYQGGQKIMYYDFLDYTENSQIDNIYTVFAVGDDAILLSDIPYTKCGVTGTIYNIGDDGTLNIKNAVSYNETTDSWEEISLIDRTIGVTIDTNAVIIKDNEIVDESVFKLGDVIRVLGVEDGYTVKKTNGTYTGYIIFVER